MNAAAACGRLITAVHYSVSQQKGGGSSVQRTKIIVRE